MRPGLCNPNSKTICCRDAGSAAQAQTPAHRKFVRMKKTVSSVSRGLKGSEAIFAWWWPIWSSACISFPFTLVLTTVKDSFATGFVHTGPAWSHRTPCWVLHSGVVIEILNNSFFGLGPCKWNAIGQGRLHAWRGKTHNVCVHCARLCPPHAAPHKRGCVVDPQGLGDWWGQGTESRLQWESGSATSPARPCFTLEPERVLHM